METRSTTTLRKGLAHFTSARTPAILLITAVILLLAGCSGGEETAASAAQVADAPSQSANADSASAAAPAGETFNGLPVGFTAEGWPFRGAPDAPVTMYEFSDFQCPFCNRYVVQTEPAINERYVQEGQVRVVFRDLPLEGLHPNAPAAHEAANCVAEQGAAAHWAMHSKLFESQTEWGALADPLPVFQRLTSEVGADAAAWQGCMESDRTVAAIEASVQEALTLGFDGTPSFLIATADGLTFPLVGAQPFQRFEAALDSMLAGELPAEAAAAQPAPAVPFWATDEGLAPDPARPGYTAAGDATRGSADAEIIVIEFSDFQCPYCLRHHQQTQPVLDDQFVETGKVRWVFKHFPLSFHLQAPAAGVASECAGDQGKFWEMYDLLFNSVGAWSNSNPDPTFIALAEELDLDSDVFAACLSNPAKAALIESDQADGADYVQGTPTFIVRFGNQGRIIPGALPEATFVNELNKVLDELGL